MIEVLFFDGCPNHEPTLQLAREVAAELGVDTEVREIEIHNEQDALRHQFLGSPSVRVNGVDIEPGADARTDYAYGCRVYRESGVPPREYLVRSLQGGS